MTTKLTRIDRNSAPGTYQVTTKLGEVIEVIVDEGGISVRWPVVNPRRPQPDLNCVFDAWFEVGDWGGVQWTSAPVPRTPTSRSWVWRKWMARRSAETGGGRR